MNELTQDDTGIPLQSTRWLARLEDGSPVSDADRRAFIAWVSSSEDATRQVVLDMTVDELVREMQPLGPRTREQRIARARRALSRGEKLPESASDVEGVSAADYIPHPSVGRYVTARAPMRGLLAMAAAIVAAILLAIVVRVDKASVSWKPYGASVSAAAEIVLEDGTRVRLSASTRIETHFTAAERTVRMLGGVAEFDVQHDPARRFLVITPFGSAEARGTVFKMTFVAGGVDVEVSKGRVDLSGLQRGGTVAELYAGGRGSLLGQAGVKLLANPAAGSAEVAAVPSDASKVFERATLVEMVAAFNKEAGHTAFELRGSACKQVMGMSVDLRDPADFVRRLTEKSSGLVAQTRDGVTVIHGKEDRDDAPGCGADPAAP